MKVHNFRESLEKSQSFQDSPFWFDLYKRYFPNLKTAEPIEEDGWAQRAGIDRLLVLADGTTLSVDEKVRHKEYPDFFLEYYSSEEQRTPGWVAKDLNCDYIAYISLQRNKCHLLPFRLLRRAWIENHNSWLASYRSFPVSNGTYTTKGVAVPKTVVKEAINDAMVVRFDPEEDPLISTEEFLGDCNTTQMSKE